MTPDYMIRDSDYEINNQWQTWVMDCGDTHSVPMNDLYEHTLTRECPCCPDEDDELETLVIHNSFDEREKFETGERKVS